MAKRIYKAYREDPGMTLWGVIAPKSAAPGEPVNSVNTISIHSRAKERPARAARTRLHAPAVKVLVVDVGGTNVKILVTGESEPRKLASGPTLTPERMMAGIKRLISDWEHHSVSIGYPGPVLDGRPVLDPRNLGSGWVGFDFTAAFGCPVKIVNDAAMQAIGSYRSGKMLFLGLGTGLGSTMIVEGVVEPMELGHLPYKKGTFEDYVGQRGLERNGKKRWRRDVADVAGRLIAALEPDDTVIGGGNVRLLKELPPGCRAGNNVHAFLGGFRLWDMPEPHASRSIKMRGPQPEGKRKYPEYKSSRKRPADAGPAKAQWKAKHTLINQPRKARVAPR